MYERLSIDEILSKYGKEVTWDIKAGCIGKRTLQSEDLPNLTPFF